MPTFSIPLSGLTASSIALSAISNNLANLNTVGYKDTRVLFRDLFYQSLGTSGAGDPIQLGRERPSVRCQPCSRKGASIRAECPRMWQSWATVFSPCRRMG